VGWQEKVPGEPRKGGVTIQEIGGRSWGGGVQALGKIDCAKEIREGLAKVGLERDRKEGRGPGLRKKLKRVNLRRRVRDTPGKNTGVVNKSPYERGEKGDRKEENPFYEKARNARIKLGRKVNTVGKKDYNWKGGAMWAPN